jgi:hypothetical protein
LRADPEHEFGKAAGSLRVPGFQFSSKFGGRRMMAGRPIDKQEQYVGFVTHCLQLAKVAADHESRALLREMAAEWLKLAEAAG